MEIYELKNEITELLAAARVIVQRFGHTKKFAKHSVAVAIKQHENFNYMKLVRFLRGDQMGKMLDYVDNLNETTSSNVREKIEPEIMEELNNWIVDDRLKEKQLNLMAR